ncbi:MAG: glycosyltransferase family 4 protein [Gemmatimonadales bacterium]
MSPHLLLTYDFPPMGGGIARWMGELAKRYPAGSLVVSTGQQPNSAAVDRVLPNRVDRLPISSRRLRTVQGLTMWSRRVAGLVRAAGAEYIWCGNAKPAAYPARWAAARLGIPYGIMVVGSDLLILQEQIGRSLLKRRMAMALLGSASVLVAISRWTAELCRTLLKQLQIEVAPDFIRTIPLGTDPRFFRPGVDTREVRRRYGLGQGRWLLSVARLVPYKGIDTGLRVLSELSQDYPELGYAVVGSGEQLPQLEAMARSLGVEDRVRFLTDVSDRDLPALYNCADIYLGLTRSTPLDVEGFGLSLVEASACGVPVVAGLAGGIPDAVRGGETGLLVDPERSEPAVEAVRRLLRDGEMAQRLGRGGRAAVESFYNWDRVTSEMIRIGHELGSARLEVARQ